MYHKKQSFQSLKTQSSRNLSLSPRKSKREFFTSLNSDNQEFKDPNLSIVKGENSSILDTLEDDGKSSVTRASLSKLSGIFNKLDLKTLQKTNNRPKAKSSTLQEMKPEIAVDSTSSKLSTSKKILLALENGSRISAVRPRKTSDALQSLQNSFNGNDTIFEQSFDATPSKKNLKSFFRRKSCECTECGGISKLEKSIQGYPQFAIPLPNRNPVIKLPIEDETAKEGRPKKNRKLIKLSSFKTPLSIKRLSFKQKNRSRDSSPKMLHSSPRNLKSQSENKKFLIIPHAITRKGNTKRSPPSIEEDFKTPLFTLDEDIAQETGQIYKMLSGKIIEESNESVNATPKTQRFSKISKIDLLRSPLNTTMVDTHSGIWKLKDTDLNMSPLHSKTDQAPKKMSIDSPMQRKSQIKKAYGLHESPKEPQRKVKIQSFSHFNLLGSQLPKVLLSPKQDKPKTCRIPTSSLESISPLLAPKRKFTRLSQQTEGSYPTISSEEFSPSLPGIHTCRSPRLQDSNVSKIKQASKKEVLLQIYNQKGTNKTK